MPEPKQDAPVLVQDDLSGAEIRRLIARHLQGMHANSPPGSVHAFDVDKLKDPSVTFWSAWVGGHIAGCGALKQLPGAYGEIKSMRVADAFLGRGIGRAMLTHIMAEARKMGMQRLWLETGSAPAFIPALKLYESAGFARCGPFGSYVADPFSVFMTRTLD
ncbi:MAG: GNAT family N-acetyltransferase [Hyphomicrobiaceae bacterium]